MPLIVVFLGLSNQSLNQRSQLLCLLKGRRDPLMKKQVGRQVPTQHSPPNNTYLSIAFLCLGSRLNLRTFYLCLIIELIIIIGT